MSSASAGIDGTFVPGAELAEHHPRAVIVHGYGASPQDHWFAWLSRQLERRGFPSTVVAMPDSSNPDPEAWQAALVDQIGRPRPGLIVIAHSLGCIATMTMLARLNDPWSADALFLVSGFNEPLPLLPELDRFVDPGLDCERIARSFATRVSVFAAGDPIVPARHSRRLAVRLDTVVRELPGSAHFLGSEGYDTFPQLLSIIDDSLKLDTASGRNARLARSVRRRGRLLDRRWS